MSLLIDPYMFELSNEKEIRDNVSFFSELIQLCTKANNHQNVAIMIYKGIIDKIIQREIQPFPIKIENILDSDFKSTIIQLNTAFSNLLIKSIESIDIDSCDGQQAFTVSDGTMMADKLYYDLLCVLLVPCYSKNIVIEDVILTGKKKAGKQIGASFQIECNCGTSEYHKEYCFTSIDSIIPIKEKVIKRLKEMKKNNELDIIENVPAIMGAHHNHVQADEKKFETLEDLSSKNKRILKLLRKIGLRRVIFTSFIQNPGKKVGCMVISNVNMMETQDIVTVKFYAETEYQIDTELYFPSNVGQLLCDYFSSEILTYQNVDELIEKIGL